LSTLHANSANQALDRVINFFPEEKREQVLMDLSLNLRAIVSHTPAPRKRTFEDFETAAKAMREQDERKESIFRQSIDNEKNKQDLFDRKFAEAIRKAKETPGTGKPLRDIDLD